MTEQSRRGVRMTEEEAWTFVANAHTGIFTTLRRDGMPMALPVWFATIDRRIYVVTRGKKVQRVANDSRSSFLVETGDRWAELQAVHLTGRASIIEPSDELTQRINTQTADKYGRFRSPTAAMPKATQTHYAKAGATLEFIPDDRIVSWDNNHLGSR